MKAKRKLFQIGWATHAQLKDSQLKSTTLKKIQNELKIMSHFFGLNRFKVIILNAVIQESLLEGETELKTIAKHFNLNSLQLAQLNKSVDELIEAGFMQRGEQAFGKLRRRVAPMPHVSEALMKGDKGKLIQKKLEGLSGFFDEFTSLQDSRKKGNIDCMGFMAQALRLCKRSTYLPIVKYYESFQLPPEELVMLIHISNAAYKGSDSVEVSDAVNVVTSERFDYFNWCGRFRSQSLTMLKEELVEFTLFDLGIDTEISLTHATLEKLFEKEGSNLLNGFKPSLTNYLTPEKINFTPLFFADELSARLVKLKEALQSKNYTTLVNNLESQNLKGGLTVLLYGHPGTGKTESVYQLARETGRAVLRLEISRIKAAWVGESEKNMKKVFSEYKRAKRTHTQVPILLFNEADAIFSKRRNINSSVDQMENALQNILLQELEDFSGILIATTNLTQNLDTAFERRFLYKLEFRIPDAKARHKILVENFRGLDKDELQKLSANHEFTGSMVENIRRKIVLNELIDESEPVNLKGLEQLLAEESYGFQNRRRIGFRLGSG